MRRKPQARLRKTKNMKETTFNEKDIEQIHALGQSPEQVQQQIERFRKGFERLHITDAATTKNGGICCLTAETINHYLDVYEKGRQERKLLKFVPASGAATRMFKELYQFSATYFGVAHNFEKEFPSVTEFLKNIHSFAFFGDLRDEMAKSSLDIEEYLQRGDYSTIINFLLKKQYLGYGELPKGLLKFHKYGSIQRTPFEEHIIEGAAYAKSKDNTVRIHFTVSPEHAKQFKRKLNEVRAYYEQALDVKLSITFSEQKHSTDTIAVDEYNDPLRDEEGHLIFRPGGHGALIENLNDCKADIVFIKNIDNVTPDKDKHTTIVYKQALAGMLMEIEEEVHKHLKALHKKNINAKEIDTIEGYAKEKLHLALPSSIETTEEKRQHLIALLHKPIRICGMVRNEGEPGGGPYWVKGNDDVQTLQIVEMAQINRKDPDQEKIVNEATHFNPVDIICSRKDQNGRYYDLRKYIDPNTGFISKKSKGAQTLKSLELPGLWNGAMAKWITLFVEVPIETFTPVKTVNDLLRKEHSEN